MPRIHDPQALPLHQELALSGGAARHVQVLRMQPGEGLCVFNGEGGECEATITRMGRTDVWVRIDAHRAVEREAPRAVHLAAVVPAGDRMDWLVEKATELGAASVQPLQSRRSVLRLSGERAARRVAHWQSVAVAGCEQCGRNRVPAIGPVRELEDWLRDLPADPAQSQPAARLLLSLQPGSRPLADWAQATGTGEPRPAPCVLLSGPEGGFDPAEEEAALAAGFRAVNLGARVLRAETAPLAALALLVNIP